MVKLVFFVFVTVALVLLESMAKAEKDEVQVEAGHNTSDRSGYGEAQAQVMLKGFYQGGQLQVAPYSSTPKISPGFNAGFVECYACVDCPNIQLNTTTKLCPRSYDPKKNSACVVYAEQYKHLKRSWYIRGCASERGTCADINQAHSSHSDIVNLISCIDCEGDRCNSSTRSLVDLTTAILSLIVTPLVAKLIIS